MYWKILASQKIFSIMLLFGIIIKKLDLLKGLLDRMERHFCGLKIILWWKAMP